ncbi:hypothetical protein [Synechocystis sp. PCC 7509]|uniref:hypothetical protein n=1 Tax=Synechocystis sp. PCC 7509 TaxID=927677 RepID=UPI00192BB969|nr:hypothetical protein [Synechocystis sp. PCC 7509]
MAGRFEGLSDLEWKLFEDVIGEKGEKRGRGMPYAPFRHVINTLMKAIDYGLPLVRCTEGRSLGIKKFSPPMAKKLASRWNARATTSKDIRHRLGKRIN